MSDMISTNNIIGGILIITGIIFGIMAFIDHKEISKSKCDDDTTCFSGGYCDTQLHKCVRYKKRYYLLIPSIISIIIGFVLVFKNKLFLKDIDSGEENISMSEQDVLEKFFV